MEKTGLLSVVIPAYNEEPNIPLAVQAIGSALTQENIPYELLFVDDGSRDNTWT